MDAFELRARSSVQRLYRYIWDNHWFNSRLLGPDPGVRFNARIGRFIKSYINRSGWNDDLVYMQGQGYWTLANWKLFDILGDSSYREVATRTADEISLTQRSDGGWDYPNPEWRGRIATVEGCFASLALLETFERVESQKYLDSALNWHQFLEREIGYRRHGGVNYWAHSSGEVGGVPNNSALVLWYLARLTQVSGDDTFLHRASQLVSWLNEVQMPTGELPYAVGENGVAKPHFWCFNYNSFQFLFLARYFKITSDKAVLPILEGLSRFLPDGVSPSGAPMYECDRESPTVLYYAAALALALSMATRLGLGEYRGYARKAFEWLLDNQQSDGGFRFYSRRNYGFLEDRRSYPRYLAIVLYQLVTELEFVGDSAFSQTI